MYTAAFERALTRFRMESFTRRALDCAEAGLLTDQQIDRAAEIITDLGEEMIALDALVEVEEEEQEEQQEVDAAVGFVEQLCELSGHGRIVDFVRDWEAP